MTDDRHLREIVTEAIKYHTGDVPGDASDRAISAMFDWLENLPDDDDWAEKMPAYEEGEDTDLLIRWIWTAKLSIARTAAEKDKP